MSHRGDTILNPTEVKLRTFIFRDKCGGKGEIIHWKKKEQNSDLPVCSVRTQFKLSPSQITLCIAFDLEIGLLKP